MSDQAKMKLSSLVIMLLITIGVMAGFEGCDQSVSRSGAPRPGIGVMGVSAAPPAKPVDAAPNVPAQPPPPLFQPQPPAGPPPGTSQQNDNPKDDSPKHDDDQPKHDDSTHTDPGHVDPGDQG